MKSDIEQGAVEGLRKKRRAESLFPDIYQDGSGPLYIVTLNQH